MNCLRGLVRLFERIEGLLGVLSSTIIIFMVLTITADVMLRYFFNSPIKGADELTENALAWFTFLAASWILKKERHVRVGVITDRMSPRNQALLGIIVSIVGGIVCFLTVIYGSKAVLTAIESGKEQYGVLQLPVGPLITVIPIGFAFLTMRFVLRTLGLLREWRAPTSGGRRATAEPKVVGEVD